MNQPDSANIGIPGQNAGSQEDALTPTEHDISLGDSATDMSSLARLLEKYPEIVGDVLEASTLQMSSYDPEVQRMRERVCGVGGSRLSVEKLDQR